MAAFDSGRVVRSYTQNIEASPERVFPLLCPVREGEWLDGWSDACEVLHTNSGVAEEGCVFRTGAGGPPETVWIVTRHEPAQKIVEFARVTTGLVATKLDIRVEPAASDSSRVHITYTHTPLSQEGAEYVATAHSEEAFRQSMKWWQDSMNHWLRSGRVLRRESSS